MADASPCLCPADSGLEAEYDAKLACRALNDYLSIAAGGMETHSEAVRAYASVLYGRAISETGSRYYLDKTPRYYFIIGDLFRLFPEAKFVFLLRNPLAVLYSVLITRVYGQWARLSRYRNDLLVAPEKMLRAIETRE